MPALTVGQTVSVPWGLDVLEGTVLRVYETGAGPRVVVQVRIPGTGEGGAESEDATLTLPTDVVEPIDDRSAKPEPGAWVADRAYERRVADAVLRAISKIADVGAISEPSSDRGVDYLIHSGDSNIAVQAKHLSSSHSRLPAEEVDRAMKIASASVLPLLLVTNANPTPGALRAFLGKKETPRKFALVRWRSPADDTDLESELRLLLSESPPS